MNGVQPLQLAPLQPQVVSGVVWQTTLTLRAAEVLEKLRKFWTILVLQCSEIFLIVVHHLVYHVTGGDVVPGVLQDSVEGDLQDVSEGQGDHQGDQPVQGCSAWRSVSHPD